MKHTTLREDIKLIESVAEGLEGWMAMPDWKGKRLFKETEAIVNERLSLLHEGMSIMKAASWLRRMAKNVDAFLDFIVVNIDKNAVAARACVNWQLASMAKKSLVEECR